MRSQTPPSRLTCQRGESRVLFFAQSPMPRSGRTNERTTTTTVSIPNQPGHVRPAFIMHASLLCIARTSKRMYFGFMADRWDTHDSSRDTGYFSPGTSLSTLARNKGRYSSPVLWSCIAAREITRDGLKPRSFTIHIAGIYSTPGAAWSKAQKRKTQWNVISDLPYKRLVKIFLIRSRKVSGHRLTKVFYLSTRLLLKIFLSTTIYLLMTSLSHFLLKSKSDRIRDVHFIIMYLFCRKSEIIWFFKKELIMSSKITFSLIINN